MSDIQQAIDLIKQGRKKDAQPILETHIRANPHDIKSWFWYVETLDSAEKRIQLLEVCLKQNPGNPQVTNALEMLHNTQSAPVSLPKAELYTSPKREFEKAIRQSEIRYENEGKGISTTYAPYESHGWEESGYEPKSNLPNIDIPENQNAIAYIKAISPFHAPIVPFEYDKVNNERNHPDLTDFIIASASDLPENCKYVVYGCAALVHPESGIIFGFAISMSAYFRLPNRTLKEVDAHFDKIFNKGRKKTAGNQSDDSSTTGYSPSLDKNWSRYGTYLTKSLVRKCYDYYGKRRDDNGVIQLDIEHDLQKIQLPTFFDKVLDRVFLLLILGGGFALVLFILYAMDNFNISDVIEFFNGLR